MIGDQQKTIEDFFDTNLKDVDLTEFLKLRKKKAVEQLKVEYNILEGKEIEGINKRFDNEELFEEKAGKDIYQMGQKIGQEPSYMPSKSNCLYCDKAKNYFSQNNIDYGKYS